MSESQRPDVGDLNAGKPCPVCTWPDDGGRACNHCGWLFQADPALLADAQRQHDLRAAVRAAGPVSDRDRGLLDLLVSVARGGPASQDEVLRATQLSDEQDPPLTLTNAGIMFALTRLVAGKTEAIAFVEIGPDAISVQTLIAGASGVPRRLRLHTDTMAWTEVLPRLPGNPELRRLRMAGGVGRGWGGDGEGGLRSAATPAMLARMAGDAIEPVLARHLAVAAAAAYATGGRGLDNSLPPQPAHRLDIVLVRRTYRWPVLDAAMARARTVIRPTAELIVPAQSGDLAAIIDDVARYAPLRYGYEVVLAEVTSSGAVMIRPRKLFTAGAAVLPGKRGKRPTVAIDVAAVRGGAADPVVLPIVAQRAPVSDYRDAAALKRDRPLIAMPLLDGAIPDPVRLRVTLDGPGELDVRSATGLPLSDAASSDAEPTAGWPELMTRLPYRVPPPGGRVGSSLDLVLLVELGGREESVAERVSLASGVVSTLADDLLGTVDGDPASGLKIAVVGYRDHFGAHRVDVIQEPERADEALLVGCALSRPAAARSVFRDARRWRAVPVGDFYAAPVEEALALVAGPGWGWRAGARHVLLTIGARPPHPPKESPTTEAMLACPHRTSWEQALGYLTGVQAVECYAVLDRPPATDYADRVWRQLGRKHRWLYGDVATAELALVVGRLPGPAVVGLSLATHAVVAAAR